MLQALGLSSLWLLQSALLWGSRRVWDVNVRPGQSWVISANQSNLIPLAAIGSEISLWPICLPEIRGKVIGASESSHPTPWAKEKATSKASFCLQLDVNKKTRIASGKKTWLLLALILWSWREPHENETNAVDSNIESDRTYVLEDINVRSSNLTIYRLPDRWTHKFPYCWSQFGWIFCCTESILSAPDIKPILERRKPIPRGIK